MAENNFLGVYSTTTNESAGPGKASVLRTRYWFVWEDSQGYTAQLLNSALKPMSDKVPLQREEFLQFRPEPDIKTFPLDKATDLAQKQPTLPQADLPVPAGPSHLPYDVKEVTAALKLDHFLRSEFALALAKTKRKDRAVNQAFFERVAAQQEGILPVHKHMFTDFGMDLRRSHLPLLAVKFYKRALELSPQDCNAYFNLARAYYELGDYVSCRESLQQALTVESDFEYAKDFLRFLEYKHSKQLKAAENESKRKKRR